jgi:hypothetical protein
MNHIGNGIPIREICSELGIPCDECFCPQVFWDFHDQRFFVYVCGNRVATFSLEAAEDAGHSFDAFLNVLRDLCAAANGIRSAFRVLTWPLWFDAEVEMWTKCFRASSML